MLSVHCKLYVNTNTGRYSTVELLPQLNWNYDESLVSELNKLRDELREGTQSVSVKMAKVE